MRTMAKNSITHCLFDLDGVILDTTPLYYEANNLALSDYGRSMSWALHESMMGRSATDAVRVLLEGTQLQHKLSIEDYINLADKHFDEILPSAKLLPGVLELIEHLHKHKIPMAICTGSRKRSFDLKMTHHQELLSLFSHVVLGSDDHQVKLGKPAPDVFLVGMERFSPVPLPSACLVFEDAPNGVQAAVAAGMPCVMIPDSRVSELDRQPATLAIRSWKDFRPELFDLPAICT